MHEESVYMPMSKEKGGLFVDVCEWFVYTVDTVGPVSLYIAGSMRRSTIYRH